MRHLSTSCPSSNIVQHKNGYLFKNAAKSVVKLKPSKVFKFTVDGNDAILTMQTANQVLLRDSLLLIRPTFWDANSKLTSVLLFRDKCLTVFEITQHSNNRIGYAMLLKGSDYYE